MIRRILDGLGYLFLTPPPIERQRPPTVQAHPEPRPRSAAAGPIDRAALRARGYELVHYHREDPGQACTCTRDNPDGTL